MYKCPLILYTAHMVWDARWVKFSNFWYFLEVFWEWHKCSVAWNQSISMNVCFYIQLTKLDRFTLCGIFSYLEHYFHAQKWKLLCLLTGFFHFSVISIHVSLQLFLKNVLSNHAGSWVISNLNKASVLFGNLILIKIAMSGVVPMVLLISMQGMNHPLNHQVSTQQKK